MAWIITSNKEKVGWVVGGLGVTLQQITKGTLNFVEKVWWKQA